MKVTLDFDNQIIEIHSGTMKDFKALIETGVIDVNWRFKMIPSEPIEFTFKDLEPKYKEY